ncbi:hypothetical protein CASFOL_017773 [Castilleja foliolosa]|uniref:Uncharacterized protein n=1 Tax=Castilleja foliolosa TaxID=1961234 RepID=A0ABD3DC91_9LAMI
MAAPIAASKLLNPRNPALQSLIRCQLLHPAAARPTLLVAQPLDFFHREKVGTADSDPPAHYSSNPNLHARNLRWRFDFSPVEIKAARTYVPVEGDVYNDFDGDDDDDDEDDEEDEVDIQDYSGSDFDDEEDDGRL